LQSTQTKDTKDPFSMDQRLWKVASVLLGYLSLNLGDRLDQASNKKDSELDQLLRKINRDSIGETGARSAKRPPIQFGSYHCIFQPIVDDVSG